MIIDGKKINIVNVSDNLRIGMFDSMKKKFDDGLCGDFLKVMGSYVTEVSELPLEFESKPVFSFLVFPAGKKFGEVAGFPIENGMCESPISLDKKFPLSLLIDEDWFEDFGDRDHIERKTGLVHELAHVMHGAYFRKDCSFMEGYAELLPHYLMDLDKNNIAHQKAIKDFKEDDMQSFSFMDANGMFAVENPRDVNTQEQKAYMSAYVGFLGYVKRFEKINKCGKFSAVNSISKEFAKLQDMTYSDRQKSVSNLVGMSVCDVYDSTTLHNDGRDYLLKSYADEAIKLNILSKNKNGR